MKKNLLAMALLCFAFSSCLVKKVPIKSLSVSQKFAFKEGDSLELVYKNKQKYSYYDLKNGVMHPLNDLSKSKKVITY